MGAACLARSPKVRRVRYCGEVEKLRGVKGRWVKGVMVTIGFGEVKVKGTSRS